MTQLFVSFSPFVYHQIAARLLTQTLLSELEKCDKKFEKRRQSEILTHFLWLKVKEIAS